MFVNRYTLALSVFRPAAIGAVLHFSRSCEVETAELALLGETTFQFAGISQAMSLALAEIDPVELARVPGHALRPPKDTGEPQLHLTMPHSPEDRVVRQSLI
jgi:hypothetical protein